MKMKKNNDILLPCIYVDDIIYLGSLQSLLEEFNVGMMNTFEMVDIGLMQYFL